MAIDAVSSSSAGTVGSSSDHLNKLAADFDTFLTLLTTQLKNQDPLDPMKTEEFTQQIVAFAGVEQQINVNKNLQALIELQTANANASALSYVGKQVVASGDTTMLEDGSATFGYTLEKSAASVTLTVKDLNGNIVYQTTGDKEAGRHELAWDGKDQGGNAVPAGAYTLQVGAVDGENQAIKVTQDVTGTITGVDMTEDGPVLVMGELSVKLSEVLSAGLASS